MNETDEANRLARSLSIAERLYGLPPAEFTAARDLAARDAKAADPRLAAAIRALRKPSTAAWVVNVLVRYRTDQVTEMLTVGEALRAAQQGMDAARLRELTKQRRQLTAAVTTQARALARRHGLRVTDQVAAQVEATLSAAMVDPGAAVAVRSGLLMAPMSATGVGEVDAGAAVALPGALSFEGRGFAASPVAEPPAEPPAEPLHAVPDLVAPDPAERAAADQALAEAEEALLAATEARDRASTEHSRRQRQVREARTELDEARRRVAELERRHAAVEAALAAAGDELDRHRRELREASAAVERARDRLAGLR
ncbi:MAG: hypothetical protein QM638_18570 [Nocardioides sp.]|uniref:hypothetical protein n=1 Tax=Nocardioides sp. TaxID=35761 RepID=UPI0039E31D60